MYSFFLAIYLHACSVLFLPFFHLLYTVVGRSVLSPVYFRLSICIFISTFLIFDLHILSYLLLCNQFGYLHLLFLIFVSLCCSHLLSCSSSNPGCHHFLVISCFIWNVPGFLFSVRYLSQLSCHQFFYLLVLSSDIYVSSRLVYTLVFVYYSYRPVLLWLGVCNLVVRAHYQSSGSA